MIETIERLFSVQLQNERTIWIRKPTASSGTNYLTLFLDGELYRDRVGAMSIIDQLLEQGSIADSWFIFVSTASIEARWRECPCHPPFAKFVAEELLPWLESRDPKIKSAEKRTLIGLSYTGLAAAFIAKEYPGLFASVICQSGSFWWNDCWLTEQYAKLPKRLPTQFYLDVGQRETAENVRHREDVLQVASQVDSVRGFRDVLLQQSHQVEYLEFDGGHEIEAWRKTIPGALVWALPP